MTDNPYGGHGGYSLWIGLAVAIVIVLFRNRRARPLKIERLWIRPLIFLILLGAALASAPPPLTPMSVVILIVAIIAGAALGWQRSRFTRIEVHPETHDLTTRVSPLGLLFLVGLVLLRSLMRGAAGEARTVHLPVAAITDGLMLFGGALIITGSFEIWLRARRLLAEARVAHVTGTVVSGDNP